MNPANEVIARIYGPAFYARVLRASFGSALRAFLLSVLILVAVHTAFVAPSLFTIPGQAVHWLTTTADRFPADLEVTIRQGRVFTTVKQPYFLPISTMFDDVNIQGIDNLLVIDTETPLDPAQFRAYRTLAWVNKTSVMYIQEATTGAGNRRGLTPRGIQVIELADLPNDITLDKDSLQDLVRVIVPWTNVISPFLTIAVFFGFFVSYLVRLLYLFFPAFLVWLASNVLHWPLSFGQVYKAGMYAMTPALIIELILSLRNIDGPPFMFTGITLVTMVVNILGAKGILALERAAAATDAPPEPTDGGQSNVP